MKNMILNNKILLVGLIFFLVACSGGDDGNVIVDPVGDTLGGDYKGGWSSVTPSVTFSNFPISAKLRKSGNSLSGEFFETSNFTSITGGSDDGRMVMSLDGDTTITSFSLNVTVPGCIGSFSGTGRITTSGDLIIDFTGTDCDGAHVGQLTLRK